MSKSIKKALGELKQIDTQKEHGKITQKQHDTQTKKAILAVSQKMTKEKYQNTIKTLEDIDAKKESGKITQKQHDILSSKTFQSKTGELRSFTKPVIVVARADGRGGIEPFGTFKKEQSGAKVQIGEKLYTVTKDGRVNIPKSIMNKGIKGSDGRMRLAIGFSSEKGINGWRTITAVIMKPDDANKSSKKGDRIKSLPISKQEEIDRDVIVPKDSQDYNWSP